MSTDQLCKLMGMTVKSYKERLNNPYLFRYGELVLLSGIFGVNIHELIEGINRNVSQIGEKGKWYIDEQLNSYLSNEDKIRNFNKQ